MKSKFKLTEAGQDLVDAVVHVTAAAIILLICAMITESLKDYNTTLLVQINALRHASGGMLDLFESLLNRPQNVTVARFAELKELSEQIDWFIVVFGSASVMAFWNLIAVSIREIAECIEHYGKNEAKTPLLVRIDQAPHQETNS